MLGCALVIAAFCLSGPGLHEVHGSDDRKHVLEGGDYAARIETPVHAFDAAVSRQYCSGHACIRYHKRCERSSQKVVCAWVFPSTQIVVTVGGMSDFGLAASEIKVRVGDGFVSLWQLD